jgi:uncharacterized protein
MAIMAKASIPGRSKTRLVPPLTVDEAAACNTAFVRDVADSILAAAGQASIAGYVAFGPPAFQRFFRERLPAEIGLIEAWGPSIGESLVSAIAQLLQRGHRSAVVVNSDSPTLPPAILLEAVEVLAQPGNRAVLGPADDGGYYLLGLKQEQPRLFQDIAWSTEHVARQTLERAGELDLLIDILPRWYDVDDVGSLRLLQAELFDGRSFSPHLSPNRPRHTLALMQSLIDNSDLLRRLARDWELGRAAE